MGGSENRCENTYRLVAGPHDEAAERSIEFQANGMEAVFVVAARLFANQDTDVYNNGRALCRLFLTGEDGFWVINPPRKMATRRS